MKRDPKINWARIAGIIVVTVSALAVAPRFGVAAERLAQPTGKIILTITGNIANTNAEGAANFDLEMLHALGTSTVRTSTSWTDGTQEFEGVLMSDLLAAVGARGDAIEAVALNDYSFGIKIEDFARYPVVLATTLNGHKLRVRDKGPLWLVYPRDQYSELQSELTDRKMVWQLRRFVVK